MKNTCQWLLLHEDAKMLEMYCFWISECFCRIYLNQNIFEYLASSKWVFLSKKKKVLHYVFSFQKQSFVDVLQNRCSWMFRKFHRTATLLKRDSDAVVFMWNLQKILQHLFLQNTPVGCFWIFINFVPSTRLSDSAWRSSQVIM